MADTFATLYNELLIYCSFLPVQIAKRWVSRRFREILSKNLWAAQRKQAEFSIPAPYTTGTVSVTNGNTAVSGSSTVFDSAMVGRQFIVGGAAPFYTVSAVGGPTALTLDRPFAGPTDTDLAYEINLVYLATPSDFLSFESVVDLTEDRKLNFQTSLEWLDWRDPDRTGSGQTRHLVQNGFASTGVPRYELWERSGAERVLTYTYFRNISFEGDNDTIPVPFQSAAIIEGALADLSRWPGTPERKNPKYSLADAQAHELRFRQLVAEMDREDQGIYQTNVTYDGANERVITDVEWLKSHDPE